MSRETGREIIPRRLSPVTPLFDTILTILERLMRLAPARGRQTRWEWMAG